MIRRIWGSDNVVFVYVSLGEAEDLTWGPEQDVNSTRVMRRALSADRPDYVVINGDLITGESACLVDKTNLLLRD